MSTRSQKRKAVEELVSGEFDSNIVNNNNLEIEQVPGSSKEKSPKIRIENVNEIKSSLKSEILADLTKILAENQKEMLKMIEPLHKRKPVRKVASDSESEEEDISPVLPASTPLRSGKSKTKKLNYDPKEGRNKRVRYTCKSGKKTSAKRLVVNSKVHKTLTQKWADCVELTKKN